MLSCALVLPLAAQGGADSIPHISRVLLERRNVFDSSETRFWFTRLVNKFHRTTWASLIRREFLFQAGDRYDSARVAETGRNLRALQVFRDVSIDSATTDSGLAVRVVTRDGWSTRPDFRFRSTGGSLAYTAALIEDNLLGTITQVQLLYQKDPDRTQTLLSLHKSRLIAGKFGGVVTYADKSDGRLLTGAVGLPYYSLESPSSVTLTFDTRHERILSYRDGDRVARDTSEHRFVLARLDAGRALSASSRGYVRAGLVAQVRRDDAAPEAVASISGIPGRTVTGAAGGYVEARHAHFIVVHGYQSFGRNEDVDLSNVVRVSLLAAPASFGYQRGGLAPGLGAHTGVAFRGGFATADFIASGLYTSAGLDSGQVLLSATAVFLPSVRNQLILHGEVGALERPMLGSEFDLGFGAGPRAVPRAFVHGRSRGVRQRRISLHDRAGTAQGDGRGRRCVCGTGRCLVVGGCAAYGAGLRGGTPHRSGARAGPGSNAYRPGVPRGARPGSRRLGPRGRQGVRLLNRTARGIALNE